MGAMRIADKVVYLSRAGWGASSVYPRRGYIVPKGRRTHLIQHHIVAVDNDATRNIWETEAEVKQMMRRLQTIRPDLGLDVPYNYVFFGMANGDLYVCEGRGEDRTGAHTKGHNTEGIGCAWAGNFEDFPFARRYIRPASAFFGWLKYERGMANLGTVHPPDRDTFGHRDFATTACPGGHLYTQIRSFTFYREEDDDDMKPYLAWDINKQRVYYVGGWGAAWIVDAADVAKLKELHGITDLVPLHASTLASLNRG